MPNAMPRWTAGCRTGCGSDLCTRLGVTLERSIDVQVTRLRRKIEQDPKLPLYLQTVRGVGYVLVNGGGSGGGERGRQSMRRFAREVMPLFDE